MRGHSLTGGSPPVVGLVAAVTTIVLDPRSEALMSGHTLTAAPLGLRLVGRWVAPRGSYLCAGALSSWYA